MRWYDYVRSADHGFHLGLVGVRIRRLDVIRRKPTVAHTLLSLLKTDVDRYDDQSCRPNQRAQSVDGQVVANTVHDDRTRRVVGFAENSIHEPSPPVGYEFVAEILENRAVRRVHAALLRNGANELPEARMWTTQPARQFRR